MSGELDLGTDLEETLNAASILRVEFFDVFADHPTHRKQAVRQDLDGLALVVARLVPGLSTANIEPLRKAANELANATNGWPTSAKFADAVQRVAVAVRLVRARAPTGWRWRRGVSPPEGVSRSDWYVASLKQEDAAKAYLRDDVAARALVQFSIEERWLCTLYWFVVDTGRLPSDAEEKQLVVQAKQADQIAIETEGKLQVPVLALRQGMHDYAARQLGLVARPLVAA